MTPEIQARINGANARCLARLTGRTVHQEASPRSQTFDLVTAIKIRKWKWLGHLLRLPGDRLVKLALRVQFKNGDRSNMLQGVPEHATFEQLEAMAQDRKAWRAHQPSPIRSNTRSKTTPPEAQTKYKLRSRQRRKAPNRTPTKAQARAAEAAATEVYPIFRSTKPKPKTQQRQPPKPKPKPKAKAKPTPWTNKQRQAFALAHWQKHHGHQQSSPDVTPPTTPTNPPPSSSPIWIHDTT